MSELLNKVSKILTEKNEKIIPENIKKDVQIFDVVGTYEGGDEPGGYTIESGNSISFNFERLKPYLPMDEIKNISIETGSSGYNSIFRIPCEVDGLESEMEIKLGGGELVFSLSIEKSPSVYDTFDITTPLLTDDTPGVDWGEEITFGDLMDLLISVEPIIKTCILDQGKRIVINPGSLEITLFWQPYTREVTIPGLEYILEVE